MSKFDILRKWVILEGMSGFLGSGPNRGQSPVEWGDFLYVHLLVRSFVRPPLWLAGWASGLAGWASGQAGWASGLAGWASGLAGCPRGGDGRTKRTDGQTNVRKISPFYRTSSPIGAAALPPPMKTKEKVEQGKGTADHLMPLGYLFFSFCFFFLSLPFFSGRSPRREALQGTRPWARAHPGPRLNQP